MGTTVAAAAAEADADADAEAGDVASCFLRWRFSNFKRLRFSAFLFCLASGSMAPTVEQGPELSPESLEPSSPALLDAPPPLLDAPPPLLDALPPLLDAPPPLLEAPPPLKWPLPVPRPSC